eukprot:405625-Prymnesium_polylepis.1
MAACQCATHGRPAPRGRRRLRRAWSTQRVADWVRARDMRATGHAARLPPCALARLVALPARGVGREYVPPFHLAGRRRGLEAVGGHGLIGRLAALPPVVLVPRHERVLRRRARVERVGLDCCLLRLCTLRAVDAPRLEVRRVCADALERHDPRRPRLHLLLHRLRDGHILKLGHGCADRRVADTRRDLRTARPVAR